MDLNDYLNETKQKRRALIKSAESYVNSTLNSEEEKRSVYAGPNAKRFQEFKTQVDTQLQKIFRPEGPQEERVNTSYKKTRKSKDRIKKVYSGGSHFIKRKLLTMIPRDLQYSIKVQPRAFEKVNLSSDFQRISLSDNPSEKLEIVYHKGRNSHRENLFLPVLSTVGNHEERSKIYKYR